MGEQQTRDIGLAREAGEIGKWDQDPIAEALEQVLINLGWLPTDAEPVKGRYESWQPARGKNGNRQGGKNGNRRRQGHWAINRRDSPTPPTSPYIIFFGGDS